MNNSALVKKNPHIWIRLFMGTVISCVLMLGSTGLAFADDQPEVKGPPVPNLITNTPKEGFALAVKLSQKGVVYVQPDASVRSGLRDQYANDPNSLIATSQVVAIHFQTVAAANNYWRK